MPPLKKLINKLEKDSIKYKILNHKKVYTSYDAAQTQKIDIRMLGKPLLIKADNIFVMAVIPGNKRLCMIKTRKALNKYFVQNSKKKIKRVKICSEAQIKNNITKKIGAMPPFGSLYKILTIIDKPLLRQKKLNLNAGSFTESLEITSVQYKKFEKPIEANIAKIK